MQENTTHNEKTIQSMETISGRMLESEEEDIETLIIYQKLVQEIPSNSIHNSYSWNFCNVH